MGGVLWRPVFNVLEEGRTLLLVNAQHIKALPGHKTDVKDSEWLADLLRHGLLKPSFIPPQPIRVLRDLTRYRKSLVEHHTQPINRIHKVLETANIKLGAVASNVVGASGRRMLEAIEHGESDPEVPPRAGQGALARETARAAASAHRAGSSPSSPAHWRIDGPYGVSGARDPSGRSQHHRTPDRAGARRADPGYPALHWTRYGGSHHCGDRYGHAA